MTPHQLPSGAYSRVYALEGPDEPVVVKLAPAELTAREATALREVEALGVAPRVLADGDGVLVLSLWPGSVVAPAGLGAARAAALGARVRQVHESRGSACGGWPYWDHEVDSLAAYHRRVVETVRALAPPEHATVCDAVLRALPALPPAVEPGFRRLHGDLWSGNVLWGGAEPGLVDWEYSRQGDPAEELAYAIEMDALDAPTADALLEGYGRPELQPRVAAWRPLAALGAGLWYADLGDAERARALVGQATALTRAG